MLFLALSSFVCETEMKLNVQREATPLHLAVYRLPVSPPHWSIIKDQVARALIEEVKAIDDLHHRYAILGATDTVSGYFVSNY